MEKTELVFIPIPVIGHLVSTVELAKLLIHRDNRFSITVLIMKPPFASTIASYIESIAASSSTTGIRFLDLTQVDPPSPEIFKSPEAFISAFIENHKPQVKHTITNLIESHSVRLAGLVLDLFCVTMIDVANELGVPSFIYVPAGAAFLGLMLHLPSLHHQIITDFKDSDTDFTIPAFSNPVPPPVLPSVILTKNSDGYDSFLKIGRRFKETAGIIVNTFAELEPNAVNSFLAEEGQIPTVYPVGPLLDLRGQTQSPSDPITNWLDKQPPSSVILLCFGSRGNFGAPQVREIALGLERSGCRFLWSLRRPPNTKLEYPTDYTNPEEVLPDGFLERVGGRGLVCGWVPQVAVLAHQAIGGFVSHCGWNSTLESLWNGVPILTWPIYAEQQLNAFEMVKELGLAVEMRLDYRSGADLVTAEEVERGVRCVMDGDSEIRRKVKEMGERSRKAITDGGSSFTSFGRFIEDLLDNN
ncbi:hypothetical protein HHK36_004646 [Tetracentron sinense]|uniref:Glycosyltransferase n=1 Tax=Tetracentron sinense TaxID=13715 RepID=A0A835DLR3_TETSI|nr:hypothetical protein HHK36_004646 [Tetracentron sinense]